MLTIVKVAIVGAESTGKSTLSQRLAMTCRQRGRWALAVPEALRTFCDRFARVPQGMEDQRLIFQAQIASEEAALSVALKLNDNLICASRQAFVFCDSTPLITALYSAWYFKDESLLEQALHHQQSYSLCLKTDLSLPWVADGLQRESPSVRHQIDEAIRALLSKHAVAHQVVSALNFDFVSLDA